VTIKCTATTKAGRPCTVPARHNSAFCVYHDPSAEAAAIRREGGRKGGSRYSKTVSVQHVLAHQTTDTATATATDTELVPLLTKLLGDVIAGRVDSKIGAAAATIARVLLEAQRQAALPAVSALEQQLAELQALVAQQRTPRHEARIAA
jgi:carbon monoxide dehydrogenase subunit G